MLSKIWVAVLFVLGVTSALQVEIPAFERPEPVCIRDFVAKDQLVVINLKTTGYQGDGQRLQMTVIDSLGNQFSKKTDIYKDTRVSFTSHDSAAIDICFLNFLEKGQGSRRYLSRDVTLEVESGAGARDWNALQTAEKLKPAEMDLKRIEEITREITNELHYLRAREEKMRDTNESTNSRVKNFSIIIVLSLVSLGVWQISYLRHYFKVKHII